MQYRPLGRTGESVSVIGLGTMTWGQQNTEAEAHAQLDLSVAHGVNLIDAAEMYPVPPKPETQGRTEECIGTWLKKTGQRDKVVIATKITGPGLSWIRDDARTFTADQLVRAAEGSLRRLQTDTIDLYQLHWPERKTNFFGRLGYRHEDSAFTPFAEVLKGLQQLVDQGKIRHFGLSNETPWGLMQTTALAEHLGLPRPVSIQNPYNLLNRSFEVGLAECAIREDVGLLAYSPLAMGVLSGKYKGGTVMPEKARLTLFDRFQRYRTPAAWSISERYVALAHDHGLTPTTLALAFINQQPFVTSNLIGATTEAQLLENLASAEVHLSKDVLREIEAIHAEHPFPCP